MSRLTIIIVRKVQTVVVLRHLHVIYDTYVYVKVMERVRRMLITTIIVHTMRFRNLLVFVED